MAKKLNLVDMYGIGVMLEYLVAEDNLTCEERDRVILRIAQENDIAEYMLSNLAGYGRSKQEVLKRAKRRKSSELQGRKQDESYISLTEIARAHSEDAPGYVIQSWLRNGNTFDLQKVMDEVSANCAEVGKHAEYCSFQLVNKRIVPFKAKSHNEYTRLMKCVYEYGRNPEPTAELTIGNMTRRVLEAFSTFTF